MGSYAGRVAVVLSISPACLDVWCATNSHFNDRSRVGLFFGVSQNQRSTFLVRHGEFDILSSSCQRVRSRGYVFFHVCVGRGDDNTHTHK